MTGQITRLVVEEGETAVPGTFNKDAATLLTISDMGVLETKVKVDETDVARISVGDSAVVQIDAFPDTTFVGQVTEISNSSVKAAPHGGSPPTRRSTTRSPSSSSIRRPTRAPTSRRRRKIVTDTRTQVLSIPIIALTVRENEALAADSAAPPGAPQPRKWASATWRGCSWSARTTK